MDGWMDGWNDWMDGWMDGYMILTQVSVSCLNNQGV